MIISYLINNKTKTSVPMGWANYTNKNIENTSINIISIKEFSPQSIKAIYTSNIVHGHHIKAMFVFNKLNYFFRKKTIYTVHGSYLYLSNQNKKLLKYIFRSSNQIIFVNQYLYDVLPNNLKKIIQNKYKVILNGVDMSYKYTKVDIYKKYNLKENDSIIFHPARFVKEKNHLNMIEAFKKVSLENENIKLVLAGDGILRESIENKIKKLGLENKVILLGLIDKNDVYNFLKKCNVFIMPSISEGLNIAFLEAMTMKTKILVSDIEQFTYPFMHYGLDAEEYNTYFANPGDIDEIAEKLQYILDVEINLEFDIEIFSLDSMIENYVKQYKELV